MSTFLYIVELFGIIVLFPAFYCGCILFVYCLARIVGWEHEDARGFLLLICPWKAKEWGGW